MGNIDIFRSTLEGQVNLVEAALAANPALAKSKDSTSDNRTALHHAASVGSLEIAQILLSNGADVDAKDDTGFTPLIVAVAAGKGEVVSELIGNGADIKATNNREQTALHYAASKGQTQIGRMLAERGADINARDKANQLPLHRAASVGSSTFVSLLVKPNPESSVKARLNLQDRNGNTPMHLAIESGHAECACLLIEAGADRDRTNQEGQRPEEVNALGDQESRKMRRFIEDRCGPLDS